ncbi:MAG: sigma-70 family RNA polymerase sigma factor [Dyadobacter sp.]|uniref:RNA polymerase sigma factor n=1 Tax=Dyadobacter sp. TaxID=1914288 RepID=UPI003264FF5F
MLKKSTYTQPELILLLQSNSREGFEYLYDNYSPALYGIILKIVKDEERAADVLQDTFLKIWKNMTAYNVEKGTLFTWILNIARNTAIDRLRTEVKTSNVVNLENITDSQLTNVSIFNPSPGLMDIREIVELLMPERKLLVDMVYFQGYTHEEASEKLNLPLGTVKSRIRKALQELRHIFSMQNSTLQLA